MMRIFFSNDRRSFAIASSTLLHSSSTISSASAALFRENRDLISLLIHGNNHVKRELAQRRPQAQMVALAGEALRRAWANAIRARLAGADLVITTYALIRRDADRYRELQFDTVVLDEAQHIKNRQTQNAQAVKAVRAQHRLVLTGTPMENSVLDLWSIFDFLMPGYLGTAQDFRDRYEQPIARENDARAQTRLARRLRPFVLRRLKKDVAADLPPRLEQVAFCELTSAQRQVYQQLIEASRKEILDAAGPQGVAKSRMLVLTALLPLPLWPKLTRALVIAPVT
jgi:SNF2 family DNA or RNA helicase